MKGVRFTIVFGLMLGPMLKAEDPVELNRAKRAHESAVKRATLPLAEAYVRELEKLLGESKQLGQADDAATIIAELDKAKSHVVTLGGIALPLAKAKPKPQTTVFSGAVTILPITPAGYPIGPVKAGDTLEVQYISGRWKSWGRVASINPDDPGEQEHGDAARLVIAESPKDGRPGPLIKMVPPNTKAGPFGFTFVSDQPDGVCLRVRDDSDRQANPGSVQYQVRLAR